MLTELNPLWSNLKKLIKKLNILLLGPLDKFSFAFGFLTIGFEFKRDRTTIFWIFYLL